MADKQAATGPPRGACVVCGAEGRACARCRLDFYCGKDHQTADWPRHKLGCGFLEVREDPLLGRHLVAAKDIPAGAVILREAPLLTFPTSWNFPRDANVRFSMCVGCAAEMIPGAVAQCERCGWPVCRRACSERPEHQAECAAFQQAQFKLSKSQAAAPGLVRMNALVALRVCLASQEPVVGPRLRGLPAKMPDRSAALRDAGAYREAVRQGHDHFKETLAESAAWLRDVAAVKCFSKEELCRGLACALLHGMEAASGNEFYLVGSVFPGLSLVGHACVPNSYRYPSQRAGTEMMLVAATAVPRGARLTTAFIRDPLNPAMGCEPHRRRTLLAAKWGFRCRCALCEDPSQAGLRLDAWTCRCWEHTDCSHLVTVVDGARWRCERCGCGGPISANDGESLMAGMLHHALGCESELFGGKTEDGRVLFGGAALDGAQGAGGVLMMEEYFRGLVRAGTTTVAEWEEFIEDALPPSGHLHPTHHLVLRAKRQILCPDRTGEEGDIVNLKLRIPKSLDEARVVSKHGHDLLRAVEVLRPGVNQYRADVLRQLAVLCISSIGLFAAQQPRRLSARKAEWKAIVKETVEVFKCLDSISVSPSEKETLTHMRQQKDIIFSKLHPALRKDAVQLAGI